jgi:hypothetical protein
MGSATGDSAGIQARRTGCGLTPCSPANAAAADRADLQVTDTASVHDAGSSGGIGFDNEIPSP